MSGGAITNCHHDLGRLGDWAMEIRHHENSEWCDYSEEFKKECDWIADLMDDLGKVLWELDYVFAGDTGEDRGIPAIKSFKEKWCGMSGASNADIINIETYLTNCLTRVREIKKQFPSTDDPLNLLKGVQKNEE